MYRPQQSQFLADHVAVNPNPRALAICQDRLAEKTFVTSLGLKTPSFACVGSHEEAHAAIAKVGYARRAEDRRLGYDGKGQAKVASAGDVVKAFDAFKGAQSILESFVDFSFEVSVVAARAADGAFAAYDPPENAHENHILKRSTVPSRLNAAQSKQAKAIAQQIAEALDYVGVVAVELFVGHDGALLVNEIAPRVHNSGHWTLEACVVSQFEQHIRAVAGWPLGDGSRHSDAVMENLIGEEANNWKTLAARGGALASLRQVASTTRSQDGPHHLAQGDGRRLIRLRISSREGNFATSFFTCALNFSKRITSSIRRARNAAVAASSSVLSLNQRISVAE